MKSPFFSDALIIVVERALQYQLNFPGSPIETDRLLKDIGNIDHEDLCEIFAILQKEECIEIAASEANKEIPTHFVLLDKAIQLAHKASKNAFFKK